MAYDEGRKQIVLFGGQDPAPDRREHERYVDLGWPGLASVMTSPSPPALKLQAFAYDPARGVSVLFGGFLGGTPTRAVWEFDGATWTDRTPASGGPRHVHRPPWRTIPSRGVIVVGGFDNISGGMRGDGMDRRGTGVPDFVTLTKIPSRWPPIRFGAGCRVHGAGPHLRMERRCVERTTEGVWERRHRRCCALVRAWHSILCSVRS